MQTQLTNTPVTTLQLKQLKGQLVKAKHGLSLLKSKLYVLQCRYNQTASIFSESMGKIQVLFLGAFTALSRAELYGANAEVFAEVCSREAKSIYVNKSTICGVELYDYKVADDSRFAEGTGNEYHGCHPKLLETKIFFNQILCLIIESASIQFTFQVLKKAMGTTRIRVNALEYMIIPRIEARIGYICNELDEREREEFYRVKKAHKNKKQ